jgi:hypothetical protein
MRLRFLLAFSALSCAASISSSSSSLLSGAGGGVTWAVRQTLPDEVRAGAKAHFSVCWGVDPASSSPAAAGILSGSFWFGGRVSNVTITAPGKCALSPATQQLVCDLGAIAVGAWGPTMQFDVDVLAAETAPHYLPYFLAGLNGFDNGPETFGRVEVAAGGAPPPPPPPPAAGPAYARDTFDVSMLANQTYAQGLRCRDAYNVSTCKPVDLLLDAYQPVARGGAAPPVPALKPALVIAHGGGNSGGSKEWPCLQGSAAFFAARGFVAFNIDYRLSGDHGLLPPRANASGAGGLGDWNPSWESGCE